MTSSGWTRETIAQAYAQAHARYGHNDDVDAFVARFIETASGFDLSADDVRTARALGWVA
jgi:hypothetical protein